MLNNNNGGTKHDSKKIRLDLLSPASIIGQARAITYGVTKYDERNWENGLAFSRLYRAALSHLLNWWQGKEIDDGPDGSGLRHIDLAACNLHFLQHYVEHYDEKYKKFDNRPIYEKRASTDGLAESSKIDSVGE